TNGARQAAADHCDSDRDSDPAANALIDRAGGIQPESGYLARHCRRDSAAIFAVDADLPGVHYSLFCAAEERPEVSPGTQGAAARLQVQGSVGQLLDRVVVAAGFVVVLLCLWALEQEHRPLVRRADQADRG